jgi:osmotically-inducible protein OsmY
MKFAKACSVLTAVFFAVGVSACTPVSTVAGVGATVGVAAAQEGGIKMAATDAAIRLQIHDSWFKHNLDMYRRLDMTIREGRVLVTGTVPNPDMRVDAIRLAWQADGVRQVINEVNVDNGSKGLVGFAKDSWITGNLRTKMTLDKNVSSINYSIDTVKGTVYLMGVARDDTEREHVIDIARNLAYVDSVVSYIRLKDEVPAGLMEPTGLNKKDSQSQG